MAEPRIPVWLDCDPGHDVSAIMLSIECSDGFILRLVEFGAGRPWLVRVEILTPC